MQKRLTANPASRVWRTPKIPPLPIAVQDIGAATINLNAPSRDAWEFLFDSPAGVPLPTAENQDFDFSKLTAVQWEPVVVPGELAMQGFDIQNNTEYYYRRMVSIPADYAGNRIYLRFDGVYSNARVWINGRFVCGHVGGFTSWDCDISNVVNAGEPAALVLGVADLEGSNAGTYNPDGSKILGDSSWASYYAHHNIGGILRDVTLFALPQTYLARFYVDTRFDQAFINAELEIAVLLEGEADDAALQVELIGVDEQIAAQGRTECKDGVGNLLIPVMAPLHWDAEHPNLYTLRATLLVNDAPLQINEEKIGFREIHYGGRGGTDSNKLYVNGKPVKLRGTCRHDVSFLSGRSTTSDEDWAEIKAYKEANINHIRTSHYPASKHLLDACDELGMYVEQENAACFQGANGYDIYCEPSNFISQFAEMVERDRNRPCILIWSLGNESGFERTAGYRMEYDYIKEIDTSRPVIFSYPYMVGTFPRPYDILSRHYENFDGVLGVPHIPVLHDEFAHLACYNLEELRRDPNVRNFWGESIKAAWENILLADGALGVDLWCGIDDVFFLPEKVKRRFQSHSMGSATGYGEWGCVLDAYRRLKPEAFLTKKAFSPVRVAEDRLTILEDRLLASVQNRFDHTNFSELRFSFSCDGGEQQTAALPAIGPHEEGRIVLEGDWKRAQSVEFYFWTSDGMLVESCQCALNNRKEKAQSPSAPPPALTIGENEIVVGDAHFSVIFDKRTARLAKAVVDGQVVLSGGPHLHAQGEELAGWSSDRGVYAAKLDNCVEVVLQGRYNNVQRVQFNFRVYGDGTLETEYQLGDIAMKAENLKEFGISFDIPADIHRVEWHRDGVYSLYPENHVGRSQGTAYRRNVQAAQSSYGTMPTWDWKDDMQNYYLDGPDDKGCKATNDFIAMREHIRYYDAHFAGGGSLRVEAVADTAVRVDLTQGAKDTEQARLIINQQWHYPDLGWGNYTGRPIHLTIGGNYGATRIRLRS